MAIVRTSSDTHKRWSNNKEQHPKPTNIFFYICPTHEHTTAEFITNKAFHLNDLGSNIQSSFCNHISDNEDWECSCHFEWYRCAIHRYFAYEHTHAGHLIDLASSPDGDSHDPQSVQT